MSSSFPQQTQQTKPMPTRSQQLVPGEIYHIYNRGVNRSTSFSGVKTTSSFCVGYVKNCSLIDLNKQRLLYATA